MANKVTTKTQDKSIFQMVPKATRDNAKKLFEAAPFFQDLELHLEGYYTFKADRLLNKKDIDQLKEILEEIYPKSRYTPTQLKQTNDDLIESNTLIKYAPRDQKALKEAAVMACVMREWRNSYKIFINDLVENESYDSVDLHEKGHVLFNHTQGYSMYIAQFKTELEKVWDLQLAKYFESSAFKNNKDKIVKMLFAEFSNIAQDMEINSKLFDNGEWVKAKKTMARSGIIMQYLMLQDEFDSLSGVIKNQSARKIESKANQIIVNKFLFLVNNINDRILGKEGDFQFCYPENKGWPNKLDWMTYMVLLVKDLDNTMQQIMKQISDKLASAGGTPIDCDKDDQGQGSGEKRISQDALDEYSEQADKQKDAEEDANDEAGIGDDEDPNTDGGSSKANGRNVGGNKKGKGHGGVKVEFETCDTFENFTKFLRKSCLGKKNRRLNSDVLYNSNRGKFASRVVVPRRHFIDKWMPTECHIIVDVSGSVPTDYVERVINSIVDTNSGIDLKNSHIIFCDTQVVSDEIMSARTKSVYAGGGTEIANGIKYVEKKKYCSRKTDKLFIISDFEDNLYRWVEAAKDIPGIKYAIGYNVHSEQECNRLFSNHDDSSEFKTAWNSTFKTIFITENIRS